MATEHDSDSGRGWGFYLLLAFFFVFVAYPLSIGPVAKLLGNSPPPGVKAVYAPVAYVYRHVPPVRAFYDWYAKQWGINL